MLLLVFLLEATVTILFFAYTDKVWPPRPDPLHPARGHGSVGGLRTAVTDPTLCVDDGGPFIQLTETQGRGLGFNHAAGARLSGHVGGRAVASRVWVGREHSLPRGYWPFAEGSAGPFTCLSPWALT